MVWGQNFNEYSTICVDDKPVETVLVGRTCLRADGVPEKKEEDITVQQIGRDKVPLGKAQKEGGT